MSGAAALASPQLCGFRLSPQQERLWALLPAGTGPYRTHGALVLAGHLQPAALTGALRALVARHEILRTTFQRLPGMPLPVQVVAEAAAPALAAVDLAALSPAAQQAALESLVTELDRLPFDAGSGPCLRLLLVRFGAEEHRLLLALPALCCDAMGLRGMAREIGRLYAAALGGEEPAAPALQYGDAAEFLHGLCEEPESEPGLAFWRGFDLEALSVLELPCAGAPAAAFFPRSFPLDLGLADGLEGLAAAAGAGLPETLFALFLLTVARLSPRPEAAASLLCAGRRYEEVAEVPGLFARGLPVSARFAPNEPVASAVRRVAATVERVHRLQDFFRWRASRDGAVPFLRFAFELADEEPAWSAGGLRFRIERLAACAERFGVKLSCRRRSGALSAELVYDAATLPRREAERFGLHLSALVAGAVADPVAAVGDLPLLTAAERHRAIHEWNDTAVVFGRPELVHGLFEEQAARTPAGIAVESEERRLTYADLEAEANRWARLLRRRGVGPEVRVGICLDRSADLVVALLAVLKAGGAWVPLEPDLPPARLVVLLEDARPALLLTAGAFPVAAEGLPRLDLRADRDAAAGESPARLETNVGGESLAYALFTSGSSGRPKGVMVSHRAICNRLAWMLAEFPLAARDAVLQKTPLGFDACIWELFVPLASGARLVLARPGGHRDMSYLARAVAVQEITVLQLVPSVLRLFLDEPGAEERAAGLRLLFCGGEALPGKLRRRLRAALPRTELHNLYGPTEAAIDATCERRADAATETATISIGRPLANVRVLLLGPDGAPVPEGRAGELHIGGVGLARGYLGRPELTAERFVPDPWSGEPGGRLYRTGDMARHLTDGAIEFLGRCDLQVKVRGVRIELGEVEAALAAHPRVRQAVVAALPDAQGDSRLVAYLVVDGAGGLGLAELREALASRLPEAMMPAAVVLLRALPLLPNGKIDRAALPAPAAAAATAAPPRTPVESLVARVWAEVLGVESVGLHQSFFDLGGNSLSATQVFSRLRKVLAVDLPLRSLFEVPTVAGFAARVETACRQGQGMEAPPIAPVPRDGPLPLSFAQQRLWFLEQWAPGLSLFHIVNALRVRGRLDVAILGRSLAEVTRRHDSLRTTFAESGGEPLQVVHPPEPPGAPWSLPVVDLAGLPAARREPEALALIARESRRPFDLERGPLLRVLVARAGETESFLLVAMHHIVSDAWSMGILVREVLALYRAFAQGLPSPLPPPACQYPDFAVWQREWLQGEVLAGHLAFWRRHLEGAPPLLRLPADLPGAGEAYVGVRRAWRLDRGRSELLAALARREGVTLFVVLLAAFQALLHRLTGQTDLVVGSDVANRNRIETEEILGFFVNQMALRGDLAGDPSFRELVARVRGVALESYVHQDLPFDRLVEALNPDRRLHPAPLFQIKMNLHNVPRFPLALPGLELEPLEVPREVAQLDLILNLVEGENGLEGSLEYSASRFSPRAMDRLLAQLTDILGAVAVNPELRLSELGRALDRGEAERQRTRERELAEARRRTFQAARRRTVEAT